MPSRNLYSTTNAGPGLPAVANLSTIVATRNTDNFVYGYDLSGISIYNAGAGGAAWLAKAVLISNKHVVLADHTTSPKSNFGIAFVNNSNTTFVYTVTQTSLIPNTDILIGVLNTTVDASLKIYKVLPRTFQDLYLKYSLAKKYNPISCFYFVRYLENNVQNPNYIDITCVGDVFPRDYLSIYGSYVESRRVLGLTAFAGDSGHPALTIVKNEAVLLGLLATSPANTQYLASAGEGIAAFPNLSSYVSKINDAMTTLAGTNYFLTQIDISDFFNYNINQIPTVGDTDNSVYAVRPNITITGYPGSTVSLYNNNTSFSVNNNIIPADGFLNIYPTSDFAFGSNNISAKITVSASMSSEISQPSTFNVQPFTNEPAPVITVVPANVYDTGPVVTGTCFASSFTKVDLLLNGNTIVSDLNGASGTWITDLLDGTLTPGVVSAFTARAKFEQNSAINTGTLSSTYNYTVTKPPAPVISIVSSSPTSLVLNVTNLITNPYPTQLRVLYAANTPPTAGSSIMLPVVTSGFSSSTYTWSATGLAGLSSGITYYFAAQQRYTNSNISDLSNSITWSK